MAHSSARCEPEAKRLCLVEHGRAQALELERTIAIGGAACPLPGLFKLVVEMAPGDPSASVTRCVFVHAERNCGAVRSSTDFERLPTAVRTALFCHGYPFSSYSNQNTSQKRVSVIMPDNCCSESPACDWSRPQQGPDLVYDLLVCAYTELRAGQGKYRHLRD